LPRVDTQEKFACKKTDSVQGYVYREDYGGYREASNGKSLP